MKKIIMDYPQPDGINSLFDGRRHNIIPRRLSSILIGGRRYYILEYYDENMGIECVTLLIEINGLFAKVPLDNYDLLGNLLEGLPVTKENINKLPENIALCQTLAIEPLIRTKFEKKPIFEFNIYMAYNLADPINPLRRKYASRGLKKENYQIMQEYHFSKEGDCRLIDNQLQNRLLSHLPILNNAGSLDVSFVVDVAPGTTASLPEVIADETAVRSLLLIPGKHKYNFFVTPCLDKERDNLSTQCNNCNIYGATDEYRDLHDQRIVFQNGFNGSLDIAFDNDFSNNMHNKLR